MKCHICGHSLPHGADRCPDCGHRCRNENIQTHNTQITSQSAPYTPPNPTRKSRGCCCALLLVIPAVILIAVLMFTVISQVAAEIPEDVFEHIYEDFPFEELTPESQPLPEAADESCFRVKNGTLMFLSENWDGDPILRIPASIDGEQVTTIGPGCFSDCADLTTIVLPDTVTVIKPRAFSGCAGLRGLFLPAGMETIGSDAFTGCAELQAIYVPGSVTAIAPGCFDDCAGLVYIFYEGNFEQWNALYSGYITPFTMAICLDGNYYHGAQG